MLALPLSFYAAAAATVQLNAKKIWINNFAHRYGYMRFKNIHTDHLLNVQLYFTSRNKKTSRKHMKQKQSLRNNNELQFCKPYAYLWMGINLRCCYCCRLPLLLYCVIQFGVGCIVRIWYFPGRFDPTTNNVVQIQYIVGSTKEKRYVMSVCVCVCKVHCT